MNDREIDALIHEHVFSRCAHDLFIFATACVNGTPVQHHYRCRKCGLSTFSDEAWLYGPVQEEGPWGFPRYSTDIAAAWQVMGHFRVPTTLFSKRNAFFHSIKEQAALYGSDSPPDPLWWFLSLSDAPRAICLAALKALGIEVSA